MEVRVFSHNTKVFRYTDLECTVPKSATDALLKELALWQQVFPKEDTFVQKTYDTPSLMVRIDGTLTKEKAFFIYKIVPLDWGMGFLGFFSDEFRAQRDSFIRDKWPHFLLLGVETKKNKIYDSDLWIEKIFLRDLQNNPEQLLLPHLTDKLLQRLRENDNLEMILGRSVIPCFERKSRWYGEHMNLWHKVAWDETDRGEALPWDNGFVLKPTDLLSSEGVVVWVPGGAGSASQEEVKLSLRESGNMFIQKYMPHTYLELHDRLFTAVFHLYFGFNTKTLAWEAMAGMWSARPYPQLKIVPSNNTIHGPLRITESV